MTREILLSISGLHLLDGEDSSVEVVTAGDYYYRNGKHFVLYDEVVEGLTGHITNLLKIGEDSLEVRKSGLTNTQLVFEKGKQTKTAYQTPYGGMTIGILTRDIQVHDEGEDIDVDVVYTLDINEESMSDCRIHMNIKSRESGTFRLS